MAIEGKIWKDGKFWLIEIPAPDAILVVTCLARQLGSVKE